MFAVASFAENLRLLADFLMPRVCVVCGRALLPQERSICLCCLADLPLTHFSSCSRNPMADSFNSRIEASSYMWGTALFHYGGGYDRITKSLKYDGNFDAGRRFGAMLGEQLAASPQFRDADTVISVPLHWTRKWKRGYNQAEVIAREVCRALPAARLRTDILKRTGRTRSQAGLGEEEKEANVAGAFEATVHDPSIRHILLIDDVFTTGSTAAECYRALRKLYDDKVRISVATLGYAGGSSL